MKKVIFGTTIAIITLLSAMFDASAMSPVFGHKLMWGIGGIHYYLSGGSPAYEDIIANSANNWVETGVGWNPLWPNARAYVQSYAAYDIYTANSAGKGIIAETKFFDFNNNRVSPYVSDWRWNEIWIYTSVFDTLSAYNKQGTITHEMGHVFGLDDNNSNRFSVMCQLGDEDSGRLVNTVQQADNEAFNSLYN